MSHYFSTYIIIILEPHGNPGYPENWLLNNVNVMYWTFDSVTKLHSRFLEQDQYLII